MGFDEFIDIEIFYEPAYWIIVGICIVGLAFGFSGAGMFSTDQAYIPFYTKPLILIAVFPIAYIIVRMMSR